MRLFPTVDMQRELEEREQKKNQKADVKAIVNRDSTALAGGSEAKVDDSKPTEETSLLQRGLTTVRQLLGLNGAQDNTPDYMNSIKRRMSQAEGVESPLQERRTQVGTEVSADRGRRASLMVPSNERLGMRSSAGKRASIGE